jgi:hypothetical protein
VVAVAHRQDLVRAAVRGGQEQGRVVGLGAGGREEDAGVGDAGERGDAFGELDHGAVEVERRGVDDPAGLLGDGLGDLGHGVGGHGGEDAAEEVEVPVPVGVPDVAALAVGEFDRVPVVEGDPVGDDGAVAVVEAAHGRTSPS